MAAKAAAPRLRVALFGGLEVRLGGAPPLTLPTRKAEALLAYLAARPGQPHTRDKLAALLWPETGDTQARNNLRHTLAALRKALPVTTPPVLRPTGRTLALDPAAVDVDVTTFERRVAEDTPTAIEAGAALYRGDLLDGFSVREAPFEEWLSGERERLREQALAAFAKLLAHQTRARDTKPAIQTALRLLALDPTQEAVHRALMGLYAQQGRRGAALRQYQLCRDVLRRELDAEPEPDTRQLYQKILQKRPATSTPAAPAPAEPDPTVPPPLVATMETPLIGREAELTRLGEAVDAAWQGQGRVVALVGEAGIGKSRLVAELAVSRMRRSSRVLVGRAYETEQVLPFGPWVDALRTGGVIAEWDAQSARAPWRAEMARLFPELSVPDAATTAPRPEDHLRLFEAWVQVLAQLASVRPLLLVLEDLHWADEMSLRLLVFLARRVTGSAVGLVVTAREEELVAAPLLSQVLAELKHEERVTELRLTPLSHAATLALVRSLDPAGREPAAVARLGERLWAQSAGNPFMVVEALRALQEGEAASPPSALPLAQRVRDMIGRRLDRLTPRGRQLAAVAAVIGREFEFALAQHATGLAAPEAALAVEELVGRRLLHVVGERLDFTHDRIREVAYDQLLGPRRQVLHGQVAEALETVYQGHLASHYVALAAHYRAGNNPRPALEYLIRAGASAARAFAFREAIAFYEQGLEVLGHLGEIVDAQRTQQELRLQIGLGQALAVTKGWAASAVERPYARARELCQTGRETIEVFQVLRGLWNFHLIRGDLHRARQLAEEWLDLAQRFADPAPLMGAHFAIGNTLFYLGDAAGGRVHLEQAIALHDAEARSVSLPLFEVDFGVFARSFLAWTLWVLGYPDQALRYADDAIVRADARSHPFSLAIALHYMARLHQFRREQPAAEKRAEAAMALCAKHGFAHYLAQATIDRGWARGARGRGAAAVSLIRQGLDAYTAAGSRLGRSRNLALLAEAHGQARQVGEGITALEEALAHVHATGEQYYEAELHRLRGELLLRLDGPNESEAEATFRQALAIARRQGAKSLELRALVHLGRLHQRQGRPSEVREVLTAILDWFTEGLDTADLQDARTLLAQLG